MFKPHKSLYLLIIGAGIAGLTAGLYAARMKLNTLILEDALVGGQIRDAYIVENYPGLPKVKGSDLVKTLEQQALEAGAVLDEFDQVLSAKLTAAEKVVETHSAVYQPQAVILAGGMERRQLPIAEEKRFRSHGIHYCELCDGHLYEGKTVAVVGGGNAAAGALKVLSKYAKKLYLIHRSPQMTAEPTEQQAALDLPNTEFLFQTQILSAAGETELQRVVVENVHTKEQRTLDLDGIFVNIGVIPRTSLYSQDITLHASGHIIAGESCETNVPGVFAAGDIRTKPIRQLTTAAADGTVAALLAERYLTKQKDTKIKQE